MYNIFKKYIIYVNMTARQVINLVTKGTIEEQILALANTKLALDQSVSAEGASGDIVAGKGEELVAKMLLNCHGDGNSNEVVINIE